MPNKLTKLRIDEISSVDKGAGDGCKVILMKRDNSDDPPYLFDDIMRKAAADDIPDDDKVSAKLRAMVDAMIAAAPTLDRQEAAYYLLHTPHGRRLAEHLNSISKHKETNMPQVDIRKLVAILEDGLMAQAKLHKRSDESEAKCFSRIYEVQISISVNNGATLQK